MSEIDPLQKALSSQNQSEFLVVLEARVKAVATRKNPEMQSHNAEIEKLIVIMQQGQSLLPRFTYESFMRQLESSKVVPPVPKARFKFTRVNTPQIPKEEEVQQTTEENEALTWNLAKASNVKQEVYSNGKRVGLKDLTDCTITVTDGCPECCFVNLRKTVIIAPTVPGSVHITKCEDCVFLLACKQVRIHETFRSNFYLSIRSSPIIEDCDDLGFAPAPNSEGDGWSDVKDFKWLKSEASPHWHVIPEDERFPPVPSGV